MTMTETYTRENFIEDLLYSISAEDLFERFNVTEDELEQGKWNYNLEYEYSAIVAEMEYWEEHKEQEDYFNQQQDTNAEF